MTTRRQMLQMAIAGLSAATLPLPARALGRIAAGKGELIVVSDGHMELPLAFAFPDMPTDELGALLAANGMPADTYTPDCNVTFLRTGDRLAIFDVGAGANFLPTTGELLANLEEAGIDPADVTDVVFTHAHPDHLWGLLDEFDELTFPDAAHHMAQAEWDFWRAEETLARMPEERKGFAVGAQSRLARIEEQVSLFNPGAEVLPGVEAVDTAGHTPGHASFMVHGGEPTLVVGDALTNPISFTRPELHSGSDQDPELAAATRTKLLDRLVADKARLIGFHLAHPGIGAAERKDSGYRFVAE